MAWFVEMLHKKVYKQIYDSKFKTKGIRRQLKKGELQKQDKFNKQVIGMRRGKQFDFTKI